MIKHHNMKYLSFKLKTILLISLIIFSACNSKEKKKKSEKFIVDEVMKDTLFNKLTRLVNLRDTTIDLNDSLSFLILPINASCPYCRAKVVESLDKNLMMLDKKHFIIISANSSKKRIKAFFNELAIDYIDIEKKLILDTTNICFKQDLAYDKPTIYYAYKSKVYKKVASVPHTIKKDLESFYFNK